MVPSRNFSCKHRVRRSSRWPHGFSGREDGPWAKKNVLQYSVFPVEMKESRNGMGMGCSGRMTRLPNSYPRPCPMYGTNLGG